MLRLRNKAGRDACLFPTVFIQTASPGNSLDPINYSCGCAFRYQQSSLYFLTCSAFIRLHCWFTLTRLRGSLRKGSQSNQVVPCQLNESQSLPFLCHTLEQRCWLPDGVVDEWTCLITSAQSRRGSQVSPSGGAGLGRLYSPCSEFVWI